MLIKKSIPLLFFLFLFLSQANRVLAVTVSQIEIIPSSPVVNDQFECVFTVDFDESNLACGLLGINDKDTKKPWDICPKIGNLGHRYTANNRRHYNCVVGSTTGVPSSGRYRIVAWKFYADGAYGDVVAAKEITILSQAPPTNTPVPIERPSPLPTEVLVQVGSPTPTPPIQPTFILSPTQGVQPTISFSQVRGDVPTISPQPSSKPTPSLPLSSLISYTQLIIQETTSLSVNAILRTKNFLIIIVTNFLAETSF